MIQNQSSFWIKKGALFLYLSFFLLLFVQFPLADSLPGKTDTWYHLAIFNDYGNIIESWFTGEPLGNAYYPMEHLQYYGEPTPANGLMFLVIKQFIRNDIWTFYVFISLLYALCAWGAFYLTTIYIKDVKLALISGLIFAGSNFAFGQLDHCNTMSFYSALFSIYFYKRFFETHSPLGFLYTVLLGGFTIYLSGYVFLFQSVILGIISVFEWKKVVFDPKIRRSILLFFPLYLILIYPYANQYIFNSPTKDTFNPTVFYNVAGMASLDLSDLTRVLPSNLLYSEGEYFEYPLLYAIRSGFLGWGVYFFAFLGLFSAFKGKKELAVIFIAGLFVALGPYITIAGRQIDLPLKYFFDHFGLGGFLRTPVRAWLIAVIPIAIFAVKGLEVVYKRLRLNPFIPLLFVSLFVLENVPFPFLKYDSKIWMVPPGGYLKYLESIENQVIIELPSSLFSEGKSDQIGLNENAREHIYCYYQTMHKHDVLNGSGGFYPKERLDNIRWCKNLQAPGALDSLIAQNQLGHIIYHKYIYLHGDNVSDLDFLRNNKRLALRESTPGFEAFEVLTND